MKFGQNKKKKEDSMKRRDFLKVSAAGVATLVIGSHLPWLGVKDAFAANQLLEITITDAVKEMVTHNAINTAECYFWVYSMKADGVQVPIDCPGPTILAVRGETITIKITNALDENHSFFIPGRLPGEPPIFDSGPILPGTTFNGAFTASQSGAHLYYDNLNEPVNRVMGLHGALIIRPAVSSGLRFTPYDNPTPHVQNLFNDFGNPAVFPGLAWEEGDPATNTPPFRTYVWLTHQASPRLFAKVQRDGPGSAIRVPANFMNAFLRDPFSPIRQNNIPQYFTINGQSGFFCHFSPGITPMGRVGEPVVVHMLNAGLWTHSMHIHANHVFVTSVNGEPSPNPKWIDVYTLKPMERVDYTVPYMRPPDMANIRGIGRADAPLIGITSLQPVWPPVEEFQVHLPALGQTFTLAADNVTPIDMAQRLSPLCYPMHDHSEPSQSAQGGNYNCGLISGIYFIGDRNIPGHMNFPMDADFASMFRNIRGVSGIAGNAPVGTVPAPGPRP
jgi:multicopper oxidase